MKHLLLSLLIFGFGISGSLGQTIKSLGYNTANGHVVYTGTNPLWFTSNGTKFQNTTVNGTLTITDGNQIFTDGEIGIMGTFQFGTAIKFEDTNVASETRTNLGFNTNLNTLWTATNASNARSAVGLGETSNVTFERVIVNASGSASAFRFGTNFTGLWSGVDGQSFTVRAGGNNLLIFQTNRVLFYTNIAFDGGGSGVIAATTRTNLGLGGGITATNTFVSYNGTNYTTNTVTISNGIITGWTQ